MLAALVMWGMDFSPSPALNKHLIIPFMTFQLTGLVAQFDPALTVVDMDSLLR